jgi:hypothetical protein
MASRFLENSCAPVLIQTEYELVGLKESKSSDLQNAYFITGFFKDSPNTWLYSFEW